MKDEQITRCIGNLQIDMTEAPDMADEELAAYVERGKQKYGERLHGITLRAVPGNPEEIDIFYDVLPVPFQRLRRITGYLVGDLSRWNDGKRAEERDRVKHVSERT